MLKINKMGMEIELYSLHYNFHEKSKFMNCEINREKGPLVFNPALGISTAFSKEYYSNHIEFNIPRHDRDKLDMKYICNNIYNNLEKYEFLISGKSPAYVGTHIHYTFKNGEKDVEHPLRNKEYILILHIYKFYHKFFKHLIDKMRNDGLSRLVIDTILFEMHRVLINHNILINMDATEFGGSFDKIMKKYGCSYAYTNGKDNIRYRPILRSPGRVGKPFSMEIRSIPNSLSFYDKWMSEFNTMIEQVINMDNPYKNQIGLQKLKIDILNEYENLFRLFVELRSSKSVDHRTYDINNVLSFHDYQDFIYNKLDINVDKETGLLVYKGVKHRHCNINTTISILHDNVVLTYFSKDESSNHVQDKHDIILNKYTKIKPFYFKKIILGQNKMKQIDGKSISIDVSNKKNIITYLHILFSKREHTIRKDGNRYKVYSKEGNVLEQMSIQ